MTVREICRRVDGLPLAIELAAARDPHPGDRACCASGSRSGSRSSPEAPATSRRASRRCGRRIDWSYDLLGEDERALLARLSVFPAGATLDAVGRSAWTATMDARSDLVERLLDASLLVVHDGPVERRYRMLETVRQYAAGRLQDGDASET